MNSKSGVSVKLIGQDGNCFAIIAKVTREIRRAGYEDLAKECHHPTFVVVKGVSNSLIVKVWTDVDPDAYESDGRIAQALEDGRIEQALEGQGQSILSNRPFLGVKSSLALAAKASVSNLISRTQGKEDILLEVMSLLEEYENDTMKEIDALVQIRSRLTGQEAVSALDELEKLGRLLKQGVLTDDEFQKKKAELLSQ